MRWPDASRRRARRSVQWRAPGKGSRPPSRTSRRYRLLLGAGDLIDPFGRGVGDPLRDDGVVAQAEGFEELLVRERDAFGGHGVAPGQPMVLLGIDQRAVEIPKDGFNHAGNVAGIARKECWRSIQVQNIAMEALSCTDRMKNFGGGSCRMSQRTSGSSGCCVSAPFSERPAKARSYRQGMS